MAGRDSEHYRLRNVTTGQIVADKVILAVSPLARAIGLLGLRSLPKSAGIWLARTSGVHTFGMQFAIDILFMDKSGRCVGIAPEIGPWRMAQGPRGAATTVELRAGTLRECPIKVGDLFLLEGAKMGPKSVET